jgi:PIN domain nuclease of toxin-antitoxin system
MRVLLDTHFVLWVSNEPSRLPRAVAALLESPDVLPYFSVASIWEISIKAGLKRPEFNVDPGQLRLALLDNGYQELNIDSRHATAVVDMPLIHRDPFDRMLVAQATQENIELITHDATLARYPGPIRYFA